MAKFWTSLTACSGNSEKVLILLLDGQVLDAASFSATTTITVLILLLDGQVLDIVDLGTIIREPKVLILLLDGQVLDERVLGGLTATATS